MISKLRLYSIRLILIRSFGFLVPKVKTLIIWVFWCTWSWWRLLQKRVVHTKLYIYGFITCFIARFKRNFITLFLFITFLWWRWKFRILPVSCTSMPIQKPTVSVVLIHGVSLIFTDMAPRIIKCWHYVFCFYLYFIICIYVCWSNGDYIVPVFMIVIYQHI